VLHVDIAHCRWRSKTKTPASWCRTTVVHVCCAVHDHLVVLTTACFSFSVWDASDQSHRLDSGIAPNGHTLQSGRRASLSLMRHSSQNSVTTQTVTRSVNSTKSTAQELHRGICNRPTLTSKLRQKKNTTTIRTYFIYWFLQHYWYTQKCNAHRRQKEKKTFLSGEDLQPRSSL
jgi:hypothetical protein